MLTLIPRDSWDHRITDLVRGGFATFRTNRDLALPIPGVGDGIPVRTGRAALVAALRSLDLPPRAQIGVPLYCCPVVFNAIATSGYTVRFVDVDPSTFCMSADDLSAKSAEVDAVIVVHMFGNVCDVPKLEQAANGRPIVEDCAQALGAMHNGRPAGSFGTFGVFSFRSGKYLSVGEGAAIFSRDSKGHARALKFVEALPAPGWRAELGHLVQCYLKALLRSRPLYGAVGYSIWNRHGRNKEGNEMSTLALTRIHKSDLAIILRRLAELQSSISRQRQIADFYSRTLDFDSQMLCAEQPGAYYNRYHYPITFPTTEARDLMSARLHRQGIDTMKYLDNVVSVARKHFDYRADCPVAEQLSKRVLVIPGYSRLGWRDVERIARQLNATWRELQRNPASLDIGVKRTPALLPEMKT